MIRTRTILAYSLSAALLLSTSGIANALCASNNPQGIWHFFDMQGTTPDIKSTSVTVKNGSNANQLIQVFQNVSPYKNNTSHAIKCVLTVNAAGTIASTSPCDSYGVSGPAQHTTVSGNLTLSSCNLTGTINVAGDPIPVSIVGGHINGNSGAGIATQGAKQVHHFTLIKN
jgi:hypothetical protein